MAAHILVAHMQGVNHNLVGYTGLVAISCQGSSVEQASVILGSNVRGCQGGNVSQIVCF